MKMEPREAALLPLPKVSILRRAWDVLEAEADQLDSSLRAGEWERVVCRVDDVLLAQTIGLSPEVIGELVGALTSLRERRLGRA